MVFITNNNSPEILEPGKKSLSFLPSWKEVSSGDVEKALGKPIQREVLADFDYNRPVSQASKTEHAGNHDGNRRNGSDQRHRGHSGRTTRTGSYAVDRSGRGNRSL